MTVSARLAKWKLTEAARKRDVERRTKQLAHAKARYDKDQHSDSKALYKKAEDRLAASQKSLKAAQDAVAKLTKDPLRIKAYKVAKSLLGVVEQGGNNAGPMVSKIIRENGGTGPESWCGDFVAYCYRHAGSKRVSRSWAAVRLIRGLVGIKATSDPKTGDLVRFNFDAGGNNHVGLFENWANAAGHVVPKSQATHILTIEGNTGDAGEVSDSPQGDGVKHKLRSKTLVNDYLHVLG